MPVEPRERSPGEEPTPHECLGLLVFMLAIVLAVGLLDHCSRSSSDEDLPVIQPLPPSLRRL